MVHRARPRLRRQPVGGRDARHARHADRAGHQQSVPRSQRGRESRSLAADARGRISRRRACSAAQDRHVEPEHQSARSRDLSNSPRDASPHRRQVVHLPAVRFHAFDFRRARTDHALDLHARISGPSAPVLDRRKAGGRRTTRAAAAAAIRIRAAQLYLCRAVEAQADRVGREEVRRRLG